MARYVPTLMMLAFRGIPGLPSDTLSAPVDPASSGASPQSPFDTETEPVPVSSRCVSASAPPPLPGFSVNSAMSAGWRWHGCAGWVSESVLLGLHKNQVHYYRGAFKALALTHIGDNGSNLWARAAASGLHAHDVLFYYTAACAAAAGGGGGGSGGAVSLIVSASHPGWGQPSVLLPSAELVHHKHPASSPRARGRGDNVRRKKQITLINYLTELTFD